MPEETLLLVEDYIDGKLHVFDKDWPELPFAHREHIGCTVDYVAGRNRYMGYLISLGIYSFKGVKVGLDCANGASWNIAKSVFDALGADTYVINNKPNGLNINNNAGSNHIEGLQKFVVKNGLDVGFAFDGDADRCLCVDEKGIGYAKTAQNDPVVQEAVKAVAEALGDTGRILVRESGTEPLVRVMVEAPDHDTCQKYVDEVVNVIGEKGYLRC